MTAVTRILCLLIGYGFGLFQTAFIFGKMHGADIRKVGSGNAGTTNALRSFGPKAGIIVLFGDIAKCILAILLCRLLFAGGDPAVSRLVTLWTGLGVILGHNYPFYMGFRGGKGIACTAAVAMMFCWQLGIVAAAVFFIIFFTTHYVSLGSLLSTLAFFVGANIMGGMGLLVLTRSQYIEMILLLAVIVGLAWFRHRANIGRLTKHTENKTYLTKNNKRAS